MHRRTENYVKVLIVKRQNSVLAKTKTQELNGLCSNPGFKSHDIKQLTEPLLCLGFFIFKTDKSHYTVIKIKLVDICIAFRIVQGKSKGSINFLQSKLEVLFTTVKNQKKRTIYMFIMNRMINYPGISRLCNNP